MAKDLEHIGPRWFEIVHVSDPSTYANVPDATPAGNAGVETLWPTDDEEDIRRWKLIPCSAQLRFANCWVRFRGKLLESQGYPEVCEVDTKSNNVTDCTVHRMADDENGNRLLWVKMTVKMKAADDLQIELCCKKIVGDEVTRLSRVEEEYVHDEEMGRFWD